MNEQEIEEMLGTNRPCPDMAKVVGNCVEDSINHVLETSEPTLLPTDGGNLVLMTEHAYKYMLNKCTEDELWDLRFLGESEKHSKKVNMPKSLKELIERDKTRNLEEELDQSLAQVTKRPRPSKVKK